MNTVEKWGLLEVSLKGPSAGNPFTEQSVSATFRSKNEIVTVDGFYDGDGVYKVRFMPSFTGDYVYETVGSFPEAESAGDFTVTEPTGDNHGPVRIANTYHFAYEDRKCCRQSFFLVVVCPRTDAARKPPRTLGLRPCNHHGRPDYGFIQRNRSLQRLGSCTLWT